MSIKTLTNKVTGTFGKQVLIAQKHSPVVLFAAGLVGVGTTAFLAAWATSKLDGILEEGENDLKKVEVTVTEGDEELKKSSFNVRLKVAIKIAKLYAPTVIVGVATVGALTGSHVILRRRNAGLAAAYAIVDKSFKDYRGRVVADQGAEKDFEYANDIVEREIVEEGPNGPEVKIIKGVDAEAVKANRKHTFKRIFDETNMNWSDIPHQNQFFIQSVQNHANDMLRSNGRVYLNDVYDMLGMERSEVGQLVGWVSNPDDGEGDGYVDLGVWTQGTFKGKEWVTGNAVGLMIDPNVDGVVLELIKKW